MIAMAKTGTVAFLIYIILLWFYFVKMRILSVDKIRPK